MFLIDLLGNRSMKIAEQNKATGHGKIWLKKTTATKKKNVMEDTSKEAP